MQERILALAVGITGADETHQQLLEALCAAAEASWLIRLREGITAEACSEAFCCAAAFTAAADFVVSQSGSGIDSFTAGEISIKGQGGTNSAAAAEALRRTAERLMVSYAVSESFRFQGVRG